MSSDARHQVDALLGMYDEYKQAVEARESLASQLAKAKLKHVPSDELQVAYDDAVHRVQAISDAMTFASPLVWMMYKFEAYKNEAQPIRTMHDFRLHCSKPGYICTKRYNFVNDELLKRGQTALSDTAAYPDAALLSDAYGAIASLPADPVCMAAWGKHEYYRDGERVAKWEDVA